MSLNLPTAQICRGCFRRYVVAADQRRARGTPSNAKDKKIQALKPREKDHEVFDGEGLFLLVKKEVVEQISADGITEELTLRRVEHHRDSAL